MLRVLRGKAGYSEVSLPDFEQQAREVLDQARLEARDIIESARRRARQIKENAHKEGYAAGLAQGGQMGIEEGREKALEEARTQFEQRTDELAAALDGLRNRLSAARGVVVRAVRENAMQMLVASAEHLARRQVEFDRKAVLPVLDDALEYVTSRPARIFLSADDLADLKRFAPDVLERFRPPEWELDQDPSLAHGDVRIEHPEGALEAAFEQRLASLRRTLIAGGEPGAV